MTLPRERYYALVNTRRFLTDLLDPKKTPKVPSSVRKEAYYCLKHYPWDMHLEKLSDKVPELFGEDEQSGT
jgi:hypothetical protein